MTYIKNLEELSTNKKRRDALKILNAGYEAINTKEVIRSKIKIKDNILTVKNKEFDLSKYENIYFIGIGKCSLEAGKILEDILENYIKDGIVIDTTEGKLKKIKTYTGTHPWPSEKNLSVGKEINDLLRSTSEKDLIINVISGGGSALLSFPYKISIEELIETNKALTKKGADIYELNTVRKHLSSLKGGQMAKIASPAEVISLIFSDVPGNDTSIIASGPTVKDETYIKDAENVLKKYNLWNEKYEHFLTETPKEESWFEKVNNFLILTNSDAVEAMEKKAEELGYETIPGNKEISGEAKTVGKKIASIDLSPGKVQINAGETTVKITGNGKGGRNQEVALSALSNLQPESVFISAASDGIDNSDVAGAICDKETKANVKKLYLDPDQFILDNNSYNFFAKVGGQIITGATGSNVSDLYILLN